MPTLEPPVRVGTSKKYAHRMPAQDAISGNLAHGEMDDKREQEDDREVDAEGGEASGERDALTPAVAGGVELVAGGQYA